MIDIISDGEYPSNVLSNFYSNSFELDGIPCNSMEGFLQSLKFRNKREQRGVCLLVGKEAKKRGGGKKLWKFTGIVHWRGRPYRRCGKPFRNLLLRAYERLLANEEFVEALKSAGEEGFCHTLGKHKRRETILTEEEFIFCLNHLLSKINSKKL